MISLSGAALMPVNPRWVEFRNPGCCMYVVSGVGASLQHTNSSHRCQHVSLLAASGLQPPFFSLLHKGRYDAFAFLPGAVGSAGWLTPPLPFSRSIYPSPDPPQLEVSPHLPPAQHQCSDHLVKLDAVSQLQPLHLFPCSPLATTPLNTPSAKTTGAPCSPHCCHPL